MTSFKVESSVTQRRWQQREADDKQISEIIQQVGESDLIARLLVSRGVAAQEAATFLDPKVREVMPDPDHLKDMTVAVRRLVQAIQSKEKIVIFGDYDVDGATSTAVFHRFLTQVGATVDFYIPNRLSEGYGPNVPALLKLREEGACVVITVDCGTTAFEPLEAAAKAGLDVIVIDHHMGEARLPKAVAVVNPNRADETSPCGALAAVGLSFLTVVSLNRALREAGWYEDRPAPDLLSLLDLVALGTVCDVVSLKGLNRAFVSQGLKVMARRENIGLRALSDVGGVSEAPSAYHLGFILGPRINAGGRLGKSFLGSRLLTTADPVEAREIAAQLNQSNAERQTIEAEVSDAALKQAEAQKGDIIVVAGKDWHPGVIGIVAGRLKERFYRPALVISFNEEGVGTGSGRSVPGVDLGGMIHAALEKGLLIGGGGHAMAAGFSLYEDSLEGFRDFLEAHLGAMEVDLTPRLSFDAALTPAAATPDLIESYGRLGPFGQGNPSPRFVISHVWVQFSDVVGKNHVRCVFGHMDGARLNGIAFRAVGTPLGDALLNAEGAWFHLLGSLKVDHWNGRTRVQFYIDDVAPGEALEKPLSQVS